MRILLIAVGKRIPDWVRVGFDEYVKRLPAHCALRLVEIEPGRRGKSIPADKAVVEESGRIEEKIPPGALVVALDVRGSGWSTPDLAGRLSGWMRDGQDVALLVGGPDGLSDELLQRSSQRWSLGKPTFPHALVRVIVAEQLYRAWTILSDHPYHRA